MGWGVAIEATEGAYRRREEHDLGNVIEDAICGASREHRESLTGFVAKVVPEYRELEGGWMWRSARRHTR